MKLKSFSSYLIFVSDNIKARQKKGDWSIRMESQTSKIELRHNLIEIKYYSFNNLTLC